MKKDELLNSELKAMEVLAFILEQYDRENINRDLEVCSELVLISKLIMQRYRIKYGIEFKKNGNVEKAKEYIIEQIKKDETYNGVLELIKNYREYKEKHLN